jgi:hypothetical protein
MKSGNGWFWKLFCALKIALDHGLVYQGLALRFQSVWGSELTIQSEQLSWRF